VKCIDICIILPAPWWNFEFH